MTLFCFNTQIYMCPYGNTLLIDNTANLEPSDILT